MRNLVDANERRSTSAAISQCAQARRAIVILEHATPAEGRRGTTPRGKILHDRYLHILRLRLIHSAKTLGEVAEIHDMTKHQYWSQLRRAFAYADELEKKM